MSPASKPALAIMARAPLPGKVKTRFMPHLTPEESATVYQAFLQDTIDLAASLKTYTSFLFFTPPDQEPLFERLVTSSIVLSPQSEGDLGQRMYDIFIRLDKWGYSPVVVIGTDIPTLQPGQLEKALRSLKVADVCLGPSLDGGYHLIGAKKAHWDLFEGVPWSTAGALEVTLARAKAAGLSFALLDPYTDVDTAEDMRWLRQELERLSRVEGTRVPRWTEACLGKLSL